VCAQASKLAQELLDTQGCLAASWQRHLGRSAAALSLLGRVAERGETGRVRYVLLAWQRRVAQQVGWVGAWGMSRAAPGLGEAMPGEAGRRQRVDIMVRGIHCCEVQAVGVQPRPHTCSCGAATSTHGGLQLNWHLLLLLLCTPSPDCGGQCLGPAGVCCLGRPAGSRPTVTLHRRAPGPPAPPGR